jgi:hypothetical protein
MTAQTVEVSKRLDDAEFEAKLQSSRTYVEQLERADQEADKGWMTRAGDLSDLYEDDHWVEEMRISHPIPEKRRPGQNKVDERSRERFYLWAEDRVTSPTTGEPLTPYTAEELLDLEEVLRAGSDRSEPAPDGIGRRTLRPLIRFVKHDRHDEVPEVLRRARKLAKEGRPPGPSAMRQAIAEHNKALGPKQPSVSKRTLDSYENRIERDWDFLVRHADPARCKALHRKLADRFKQEVRWAKGEAWTA